MVVIVAISAGSTYVLMQNFVDYDTTKGSLLTANVVVTHYDGDGNILGLRQTGNHIVAQGMEQIMRQLFDDINQTANFPAGGPEWDVAPGGTEGKVKYMEIGTGGERRLLFNNTIVEFPIAGCARENALFENVTSHFAGQGDPGNCVATGMEDLCRARMNVTAMASFSGMSCASGALDIDEAGMFNQLASPGGEMFSRNTFGGVVLQAPDTLALDWEFTFTDN